MHELSVAHAVVSTVTAALPDPPPRVLEVRLRVGALSGVVPQALEFAYEVAALGTPLADAVLVVESVPVTVHCPACDADGTLAEAYLFVCPTCGEPTGDVRTGKELEVASIVLDAEPPSAECALVAGSAAEIATTTAHSRGGARDGARGGARGGGAP